MAVRSLKQIRQLVPESVKRPLRNASLSLRGSAVQLDKRRHASAAPTRLNIGGGNWYQRGWINADLYASPGFVDIALDLRVDPTLRLKSDSLDLVFSSHVIEHIDDQTVSDLLSEVYRVLKPGGLLRIATPDPRKAFSAYSRGDQHFFDAGGVSCKGDSIEQKLVNFFASYREGEYSGGPIVDPADVVALVSDEEEFPRWCVEQIPASAPYRAHVNSWTATRLIQCIRESGFSDAWESGYRQSIEPELRGAGFDNRPTVSLFVEAKA